MGTLDLTLIGLNADQVSVRLGPGAKGEAAWSGSKNTRFWTGVLESVRGEEILYPGGGPAGAALWAESAAVGGEPWIIYVTAAGIGSFDGAHRNHTPAGWQVPRASQISLATLNGLTVVNAPPNPPYNVVRAGGAATVIPGWPVNTYCNCLQGFKYYLVAGGIFGPAGNGESIVMWSDAAEPGLLPASWTAAADNDAGDLSLSDFPGPILCAAGLADVMLFYKFGGVFALAWVGGQAVMGRRVVFPNRGAINGSGVQALARDHVVASNGDLIDHDGAQLKSIVEGRFRRYFQARVQSSVWEQVRLAHDISAGEVWCAYPLAEGGPLVEALVWSTADDSITVRELPACNDIFYTPLIGARRKWSEQTFPWIQSGGREWSDIAHGADATGILCCLQSLSGGSKFAHLDSSGVSVGARTVYAERVGIGVAPFQRRKLFKRIRPRVEGEQGSVIQVQVGAHDEIGAPVVWGAPIAFTVGADQSVPCLSAGRYAAARFVGQSRWRVEGFQMEFDLLGQH